MGENWGKRGEEKRPMRERKAGGASCPALFLFLRVGGIYPIKQRLDGAGSILIAAAQGVRVGLQRDRRVAMAEARGKAHAQHGIIYMWER